MRERFFRFKEFSVRHECAAMKVGTDGVSLGAVAPVGRRVLDVGCGCGLIGLMMAQRGAAEVVMLDVDPEAAAEAVENAAASPWADKMTTLCCDFLDYHTENPFDAIVCNPPFFANGLQAPDPRRAAARSEDALPPQAFMAKASRLLAPEGNVSIIIPPDRLQDWSFAAGLAGLHATEIIELTTKPAAPPRRVIATFRQSGVLAKRSFALNSDEYHQVTAAFYLDHA